MMPTHYQILEILPTASQEVIHAAFRARMKQLHPDSLVTDGEMASQVTEAYAVLSNPDRRKSYDEELEYKPDNLVGNRYRIIEKIATGGFGTTYKAEQTELPGALVCIKHAGKILPEYEAILAKEAMAMWNLRHHAIPPIRDYLRLDNGSVALVMGYVEGPTLQELIDQNGAIEPESVIWIAERVMNALLYLHLHGVIHGDLKPSNLIIQPDSHEVVVVDFGLSAIRPTEKDGSIGYTEYFGAPEAKRGLPLLPQSDMYSLGATMIFAMSADLQTVQDRSVPTTVPVMIQDLIRKLTRTNPLERPDWQADDLMEMFISCRVDAFGRRRSGMKSIEYVNSNR